MTESTDKQLPDERQLDEYLKGDSSVSRQYRQLHSAAVPADLDRLVLRQAEDAVKNGASRGRPAWVRWTAPLAVAASAVLMVSIVMETGVRDETAVLHAPQPTMQAKERGLVQNDAEEAVDSVEAASEGPPAGAMVMEEALVDRAPMREAPVEPRQEIAPVAPPPVKLEMPEAPAMYASEAMADAAEPTSPATEAQQATASTNASPPFAESPPPPPPVAAPADPAIMPARSVSRAAEDAARVLSASSLEREARKQSAAADESKREDRRSASGNAFAREVSAEMPGPEYEYTDPEAWLTDIRELRKENKQEQADREWRRFRIAFPNHEVAETDTAREAKK